MIAFPSTLFLLPTTSRALGLHRQAQRPVDRLLAWRDRNPKLFESLRIAGMKSSVKVRANLQRLHRDFKIQWRKSALQNPKLQASVQHIAAKTWRLTDPLGRLHEFRNLKKFVRDHEHLFDAADVEWKEQAGRASGTWCRAFQNLSRLRPSCSKPLSEWQGWKWAA